VAKNRAAVRAMAGLGYQVTLYPINGCRFDPAAVHADMPDSVEVMYRSSLEQFPAFMVRRLDYFHAIWVARTHNLAAVRNALARAAGESGARPPIILDTEAVVATREALRAAIEGRDFDLDEALGRELAGAEECRAIVATNKAEAALLRERGFADVSVIGHALPVRRTPRPFAERAGMLFVGAMHLPDSPNYDSLCWFVDEVLPLIGRKLGWRTRLTVVGYTGPGIQLDRFRDHPQITLRGAVTDLEPLYDSHLVFAAPTRIAAGTPYKVHEAASFGLPVVATNLLRRQLGWEDGLNLLSAEVTDPAGFAERLIAVQSDETLWTILREAALQRIHAENNPDEYAAAISAVLDPPRIIFSPQPSPTIGVEANDIACGATESHQVATAMTPNAEKPPPAA
jgi:glycosyltransferase involved in cell wall biosynthesis